MAKSDLNSDTIDTRVYWFEDFISSPESDTEAVYLLPAYDEFIISYQDRSSSLTFENCNKSISSNGIFRPVIVVNGQAVGIWKRTIKKDRVSLEVEFFEQPNKVIKAQVEKAAKQYGSFLEKKAELGYK